MNHDDVSMKSMFDSADQGAQSAAIKASTNVSLSTKRSNGVAISLAATQEFEAKQALADESPTLNAPVVDNFLPSPNRLLVFGSLGLVGALGLGVLASSLITHRTTITTQAVIQPANEPGVVQTSGGGTVEKLFVQNYDSVKPDQVIASLENSSLRTEIFNIEAQVSQLEEQINQVNGEIIALEGRQATQSRDRQTQLIAGDTQALAYSRGLLLSHRSDLSAQLNYQRNRLNQAEKKLDNLVVRAPSAGIIYSLGLNALGQSVQAEEVVAKINPEGTTLEIKASVSDVKGENIEVGYPTHIQLDNCETSAFRTLKGEVSSVEPAAEPMSSTDNGYTVTVAANPQTFKSDSNTCELLPGTEGEVTIITKQEKLLDFFLRKLRLQSNV